MDLYDDLDTKQRAGQIDGWSSGIKMLQAQLASKKAALPPARKESKKILTPVVTLKAKKDIENCDIQHRLQGDIQTRAKFQTTVTQALQPPSNDKTNDCDWDVVDEYDPLWPNEYEKLVKEKRERDNEKRDNRKDDRERKRRNTRFAGGTDDTQPSKYTGFGSRPSEEDTYSRSPPANNQSRITGAAIAPPASLQEITSTPEPIASEISSNVTIPYGANSVAAKIMAKYGFKDGQGLGKQEQGMSMALQVEKTSKRGGRIIHEKEFVMPLPPVATSSPPPPALTTEPPKSEPSITEIMKSPSKVVLLRNMVGPGDVDNELEPEVKDECNTKYGDVASVIIHELQNVVPEDAVRIFVEFKRIESAIKAVVDLNGRFFGGRQVKAGFYNFDKFKSLQLFDGL